MDMWCSDETDMLTHSIITIESKCSWVRYRSHSCCCLHCSRRSGRRMRRISEHDPFQVQERFGPSHISRLRAVRSRCEDHRSVRPHIVAVCCRDREEIIADADVLVLSYDERGIRCVDIASADECW